MAARHTTREIGLAFETHSLRFLNGDLRMALAHVGGAGDGGVDLRGWWWLPKPVRRRRASKGDSEDDTNTSGSSSAATPTVIKPPGLKRDDTPDPRKLRPLRVVAQCKAETKTLGPWAVRELEGVLSRLGDSAAKSPPIGILLSQSGFTRAAMVHASGSVSPMLLVHLPGGEPGDTPGLGSALKEQDAEPQTDIAGAWWNPACGGVLGSAGVTMRRQLGPEGTARVGIWYAGQRMGRYGLPPLQG